ncbi:hypothetical protein RJT34_03005 [Clitoria ternatea]|uniref:Uncharacterized protein n=1 Tax=Clitoria ternatea TaxID=43366 RepID=A0AAN9Q0T6_CLITE
MGTRVYSSQDLPNETNDARPPGSGIIVEERRGRRHKKCIEIVQGVVPILSDGWPIFTVESMNRCKRECKNIHV